MAIRLDNLKQSTTEVNSLASLSNLRSYLFESVSNTISYFIGLDIYNSLGVQEPRVNLNEITIEGIPDENLYRIAIGFSIPNLDIYNLSLNATLNKEGYVVV